MSTVDKMDTGQVVRVYLMYRNYLRTVRRRQKRTPPAVWMKDFLRRRRTEGMYNTLLRELRDPTSIGHSREFQNYMRMDGALFEEMLEKVGPAIERQDTSYRWSVSAGERLAITLRFLATGDNYASLQAAYRVSRNTICKIVPETCKAIIAAYDQDMIKCPSTVQGWLQVAQRYGDRWNFAHAIGAIDGKHIRIRNPPKGKSDYYNYKKYFSIIMLAVVDADYRFMYLDIGNPGSYSDAGIYNISDLLQAIQSGAANLPPSDTLLNDDQQMPYFLIGDDAFALKTWMMKPYPYQEIPSPERSFNYRLSRARRCVECAFGILVSR